MDNQDNQNNQNNQNDNRLFYGICATAIGILCLTWMKEDSFSVMGAFTVQCKTLGIILLVIGGWNLLNCDGFANLIGEILALPFRLLGWLLEHWYLTVAVIALLVWFKPWKNAEPENSSASFGTKQEQTVWKEEESAEESGSVYEVIRRNGGACKNLTQDVRVLLVFVNDNESSWTQQEISQFTSDLVDPALGYIEYHAAQYGYSISVDNCTFTDDAGYAKVLQFGGTVATGNDMANIAILDMLRLVRETYGLSNDSEILEIVRSHYGTEQVPVIFCLDKPGRSFANAQTGNTDTLESALLYTSYKGADSRASVVAHELMHLFGAEDMYGEDGNRENRYAMAKQLHPNEIFCSEQWNLYDNTVSSFTAYAVGWLDELPAEYDCPEWWS